MKKDPRTQGENNGRAKLSMEDVKTIREMLSAGHTGNALAAKYKVSRGLISLIKHNKLWSAPEEKMLDKWR